MKVKDLITRAMTRLSDTSGKRWSRDTHLDNLNFGLTDLARRTGLFRHIMPLETGQEPFEFVLNRGTHHVYLVEYNNVMLEPTSWRELFERDSEFATRTGDPTHWYQDISDITKIRVWPIPEGDDEDLVDIFPDGWGDLSGEGEELPAFGAVTYATENGIAIEIYYGNPVGDVDAPDDEGNLPDDQLGVLVYGEDASGIHDVEFSQIPAMGLWSIGTNAEPGVVRYAYSSKCRVGYTYIPDRIEKEDVEIPLPDQIEEALLHWMMARAYELDGETIELNKARYFRTQYEAVVEEMERRANDGFNARPRRTRGWWL